MRKPTRTPAAQREYDAKRAGTPHRRYSRHKTNAKLRGIQFRLTFDEWWAIWEASGHWPNYGRQWGQYVMARFGDQGAYEEGNVSIVQCRLNSRENADRINLPAIGRAARAANPVAKHLRVNRPQVVRPKKGKGSYTRKGR